jgi:hypothetical protein
MPNVQIDIPCPKCRRKMQVSLEDLRPGEGRPCEGCGTMITFKGADGSKVQAALDLLGDQAAGVSTKVKVQIRKK